MLAPIVLFVYNRPYHTQKTIEALKNNELATQSQLFVFSDGPKNHKDIENVNLVRDYIKTIEGFKNIKLIKRDENWGLSNSIIHGVNEIVNRYGKIIVLEDDIFTSKFFLKFMNEAIEFYKNEKKVWHISGWNYPIKSIGLGDVYLWQFMNCWGWATWSDRWCYFEKDIIKISSEFSKTDIFRFNLYGVENFWNQFLDNKKGRINTWAIFWYITIFKHNGLCLNPSKTFVQNIGLDGSGIHSQKKSNFTSDLSLNNNVKFKIKLKKNLLATIRIQFYYISQKRFSLLRVIKKLLRINTKKLQ
jgi:hypothetical protein